MSEVVAKKQLFSEDDKELMKKTIKLAWPAVFESVLLVIGTMIDNKMVSGLGKAVVAGIGLTGQPKFFLLAPIYALSAAASALVARKRGEEDTEGAYSIAKFILLVAGIYSIIIGTICVVFGKQIVMLCGANENTYDSAHAYFIVVMGGIIFYSLILVINGIFRASGKTKLSLITSCVSVGVDIFFNYCLIEGHLGFPRLEATGDALATVFGTICAFIIAVIAMIPEKNYISIKTMIKKKYRITKEGIKSSVKFSTNTMSEDILKRLSFLIIGILAAKAASDPETCTNQYAAHQIGMSLLNLAFGFGSGMMAASITLSGTAIGQKNIKLARKYTLMCQIVGLLLGIIASVIVFFIARWFFGLYFTDQVVVEIGVKISRFICIIIPIQLVQIVFSGTLRACGDIKYTLISSTAVFGFLNVILDFILVKAVGMEIYGIWTGMLASQTTLALCHFIRYRSGKWENKKI